MKSTGSPSKLFILDEVFSRLQDVADEVRNFTPLDVPTPYQITWNYGSCEKEAGDINASKFKRGSTPIRSKRSISTTSSGPGTTYASHHHRISFESEFYKLLDHYNSLMQLVLLKNNEINIHKFKLHELVNLVALKLEELNQEDSEKEEEEDDGNIDIGSCDKPINSVNVNDQSLGHSESNFQRKMDEISKKLMEIFNPQEEFESDTVDSTTIDSYILHKKKKLRS